MLKFLGRIISSIYSLVLFAVIFIFILLYFIIGSINKNNIINVLTSSDFDSIKLTELNINIDGYDEEDTLEDLLVDYLMEMNITKKDSKKILANEDAKKIIGTYIVEYIEYSLLSSSKPSISNEELNKILKDNSITSITSEKLILSLNEILDNSMDKIEINDNGILSKIGNYGSKSILFMGIGIMIISFFILALFNWSFSTSLVFLGIPSFVNGLLFMIISVFYEKLISWLSMIPYIGIFKLFKESSSLLLTYGMYVGIIGLVLIILGKITEKED